MGRKSKAISTRPRNRRLAQLRRFKKNPEEIASNDDCNVPIDNWSTADDALPLIEVETENVADTSRDIVNMDHDYCKTAENEPDTSRQFDSEHGNYSDDIELEVVNDSCGPSQEIGFHPEGRRFVDLDHLFQQILAVNNHGSCGCNITDMYIVEEKRNGLFSTIRLKCKMCNIVIDITTDKEKDSKGINNAAALGVVSSGIGYSTAEEFLSFLNVPFMDSKKFSKCQNDIADTIHETLWNQINENGIEEARLAKLNGDVDSDGIPCITMIADGAWSKRSYNINYNALSGVACIIGQRTQKLLFLAVRNKYCCICARSENKGSAATEHLCYRNYNGPSTGMETEIIVEGFKKSLDMHGIKYTKLVGDGDSSVYKKLVETRPYGTCVVDKVECTNHLIRNFSKHLREIKVRKMSKGKNLPVPMQLRKLVDTRNYRLVAAVKKAVEHRRQENIPFEEQVLLLIDDMKNAPSHVFGEHKNCAEINYFNCERTNDEENYVPAMSECGLYEDVQACFKRLIDNAYSLILNMTNNAAEQYNSIVCKFVSGKRINYSTRRSYETRCEAAAISYNSGEEFHKILHKKFMNESPRGPTKNYIIKVKLRKARYKRMKLVRKRIFKVKTAATPDEHYGTEETEYVPDITDTEYQVKSEEFLNSLRKTREEILKIEELTRGQAGNPLWFKERTYRITASNFKSICSIRKNTSCVNKVNNLLYNTFLGNANTQYGKQNEVGAIRKFEEEYKLAVEPCGFFIDEEYFMLGASPDGLIGLDAIIEIKCPANAVKLHPIDAIKQGCIKYVTLDENNMVHLRRNHQYYFQIQGQLHITQRSICYFVIWTQAGILVEKIEKDDFFWTEKMEKQLENFYHKCLLPEIIDPRKTRGMEIRNPPRE